MPEVYANTFPSLGNSCQRPCQGDPCRDHHLLTKANMPIAVGAHYAGSAVFIQYREAKGPRVSKTPWGGLPGHVEKARSRRPRPVTHHLPRDIDFPPN